MTQFKNLPLFGQDSSPQNTSTKLGFIGTLLFGVIFTLVLIFIKPAENKPKYKEVQIVLSSSPVEKKVEEAPAPAAPAPAPSDSSVTEAVIESSIESAPVVKQPEPVKPKIETPKTEPAKPVEKTVEKTVSKPVVNSEPVVYAKSVEELMAEQLANKNSSKPVDYDPFAQFDDDDFEETTESEKRLNDSSASFSGSAATATENTVGSKTSTSTTTKETNKNTSSATKDALGKITNSKFFGSASDSVDTEAVIKTTASGNGKVSMVMANGSSRLLLDPIQPVINLSEEAALTIDGSRSVIITFTVTESGNVPRGEISITPESNLSGLVREEIRNQISKWRFETANYVSTASFDYKIVKYN